MRTMQETTNRSPQDEHPYAMDRDLGYWELTFEGQHATFKNEAGAQYVAYLLLHPPPEPIHALTLALDARTLSSSQAPGAAEVILQRYLGLDYAETVRSLRRRQHALEAVLDDRHEIEPVKAEVLRELEGIADSLRQSSWRSHECARKCTRGVSLAIQLLLAHLARAVDVEGRPHPVLQAFAQHLENYLLIPSGRERTQAGVQADGHSGWYIYAPPPGVVWEAQSLKSKVQSLEPAKSKVSALESKVQCQEAGVQGSMF